MNTLAVLPIVLTLGVLAVLVTASTVLTPAGTEAATRGASLIGFRLPGFLLLAAIVAVIAHALTSL